MTAPPQVVGASPSDLVRAKLDEPQVAQALSALLEHADLLAILVTGLDGLLRRSDEIGDSLTSTVGEFTDGVRAASRSESIPEIEALRKVDLAALARSLAALSDKAINAVPALDALLGSRLTDPQAAAVLVALGDAVVEARTGGAAAPHGVFGLVKATRDPDVVRGVGFLLQVTKSFGRRLR